MYWAWLIVAASAALVLTLALWRVPHWLRERRRSANDQARRDFHMQRERLECVFLQTAAVSGKPRGLRWIDCDFDNDVTYACNRRSGELAALVGCTISFEAIEGGGMEDVAAVSNLRAATAVFEFNGKKWQTLGRAIFNLNPAETIEHFRDQLVLVGQESAGRAP
ncbi:MAG: hypothetical protein WD875_17145 [Pirellulales bacterium]